MTGTELRQGQGRDRDRGKRQGQEQGQGQGQETGAKAAAATGTEGSALPVAAEVCLRYDNALALGSIEPFVAPKDSQSARQVPPLSTLTRTHTHSLTGCCTHTLHSTQSA